MSHFAHVAMRTNFRLTYVTTVVQRGQQLSLCLHQYILKYNISIN